MLYEVIDYDDNVSVAQIARLILDGWEVDARTDDPDLDWVVYIKEEPSAEGGKE